jgi:UDP-N-acetylmuramoyl-L-alanyl-D-glutamate--2,6-diaminopimelate ligase
VLVVGLGRAGEAAARALVEQLGPGSVYASDDQDNPETRAVAAVLGEFGVQVALGERPADWPQPAAVVKSPGIRPGAACLPEGVPTIDELDLGWRLSRERVAAVTGTNGKGTTAWLLAQIIEGGGTPAVVCGNFELGVPFSAASVAPGGVFVVEASSYQLETPGAMLPEVAVLTNLGEDHRDRHGTRETYGPIKRRLFVRGDRTVGTAVLCADDGFGRELAVELRERGAQVTTFGRAVDADYRIESLGYELAAAELVVAAPGGRELRLRTRLPGAHNALNAIGALAAAEALGIERAAAVAALAEAIPVPGRFEAVEAGQSFTAIADFAHNPDGYAAVLGTARELTRGKVRVAIGARGGMDQFKRPAMGEVAARLADQVFVTSGEDRGESRELRIEQLLEGARRGDADVVVEPDRRRAIAELVAAAEPGDVVLVLGRGAQTEPLCDGGEPYDDRVALRAALLARA